MANETHWKRPNFFIVGAPRAGTTSMNGYLRAYPEIFIPYIKEAHFFGADLTKRPHPFFVLDKTRYLELFAKAGGYRAVGETSVMYLYSRSAPQEIKDFSPLARIIIMLRHPVDMIYSHHAHLYWAGYEDLADFREALAAEPDRRKGRRIPKGANLREALFYRDTARYSQRIRRYLECFGEENVHVILYDDLRRDTAATFRQVLRFLNVTEGFTPKLSVSNAHKVPVIQSLMPYIQNPPPSIRAILGLLPHPLQLDILLKIAARNTRHTKRPPLSAALRRNLINEFADDIKATGHLIGRNLEHWLQR